MFIACLTATALVFFSICFANPAAASKPGNPGGSSNGSSSGELGRDTQMSGHQTFAGETIAATLHAQETNVAESGKNSRLLGELNVVPEPNAWSMVSLGFILLVAQRRIFRSVEK